ncbi:MAG TPA: hypothetical protein VMD31_13040 [Opitutaceae bacterium]|nr:hypothetical protein [Opitutaceae bacterium]
MKAFLSILSLLALALGAFALGTFQLDFGNGALAALTAVMFGLAALDGTPARRAARRLA